MNNQDTHQRPSLSSDYSMPSDLSDIDLQTLSLRGLMKDIADIARLVGQSVSRFLANVRSGPN